MKKIKKRRKTMNRLSSRAKEEMRRVMSLRDQDDPGYVPAMKDLMTDYPDVREVLRNIARTIIEADPNSQEGTRRLAEHIGVEPTTDAVLNAIGTVGFIEYEHTGGQLGMTNWVPFAQTGEDAHEEV